MVYNVTTSPTSGTKEGRALANLTESALDDVTMDEDAQCHEGETKEHGCDEVCKCNNGRMECRPRCTGPLVRSTLPSPDPNCFLKQENECCSKLICSHSNEENEPMTQTCIHKNQTYQKGEQFNVDCTICECTDNGAVQCKPRCPPTTNNTNSDSDRCLTVPDKKDPCCTILYCDVNESEDGLDEDSDDFVELNLVSAVPANNSAVILNFDSLTVPDHIQAEISQDKSTWLMAKTSGHVVQDLKPGNTYYFRVVSASGISNVVSSTLPKLSVNSSLCEYKGKTYKKGVEFHDGCTAYCMCAEEGVECAAIECPTDFGLDVLDPQCLKWENRPVDFKPMPPRCCPDSVVCVNNGSCVYKGESFENWSDIPTKLSGCEMKCYCQAGNVNCMPRCPPIPATPPQDMHCASNAVPIVAHPPDDNCCLHWMCPSSNGSDYNEMKITDDRTVPKYANKVPFEPFLGPYNPNYLLNKTSLLSNKQLQSHNPVELENSLITNITSYADINNNFNNKTKANFNYHGINIINENITNESDFQVPSVGVLNKKLNHFNESQIDIPVKTGPPNPSSNQNEQSIFNKFPTFQSTKTSINGDKNIPFQNTQHKSPTFETYSSEELGFSDSKLPLHLVPLKHPIQQKNLLNAVPYEIKKNIPHQNDYSDYEVIHHQPHHENDPQQILSLIGGIHQQIFHSQKPFTQNPVVNSPYLPTENYNLKHDQQRPMTLPNEHPYFTAFSPNGYNNDGSYLHEHLSTTGLKLEDIIDNIKHDDSQSKDTHVFVISSQPSNYGQGVSQQYHPQDFANHPSHEKNSITVHALEAIDENTVRLVFSVPMILVGLHGRVELRYTADNKNSDPDTWEQQVLAPPDDIIATPELEFKLEGLTPNTEYKIKITVVMRDLDNSPVSQILTVKTLPASFSTPTLPPAIPVDPDLHVVDVNSTSATLSWRKFAEKELQFIDGVQLRYKEIEGKVYQATPLIHRAVTSYTIEDLKPESQYEVGMLLIPFPGQTTELQSQKTVHVSTTVENDPYKFELVLDMHHIKSTSVEVTWSGVPYPEDKYVNIFRAIYQYEGGREDMNSFKVAKRDSPSGTLIQGLKPDTRYRLWIEAYLTNGKIKKSNVKDFITKKGTGSSVDITQGKFEGASLAEVNDYYGPLVGVSILAAIAILVAVGLLVILARKHGHNKAPITTAVQRKPLPHTAAYDNPSYKTCEGGSSNGGRTSHAFENA
nr:putative epidermal cell surface receptor isoform X1 [Halyomorpha halys]